MYYLQLAAPTTHVGRQQSRPRDIIQGPFASAKEAQAYWTKLTMWFPEALQGADYRITKSEVAAEAAQDRALAQ